MAKSVAEEIAEEVEKAPVSLLMKDVEKSEVCSKGKSVASVSNEIEYLFVGFGKATGLVETLAVNGRSHTRNMRETETSCG